MAVRYCADCQADILLVDLLSQGGRHAEMTTERGTNGGVQAVSRALDLLELLSSSDNGCRLKELSRRSGLAASTTHRLLTTLYERNFVAFDRETFTWRIASNALSVGSAFLRRRRLQDIALPKMHKLAQNCGATVNLGILLDRSVLLLEQVFVARSGTSPLAHGARLPLHVSAMGKILLLSEESRRREAILCESLLRRITRHTITQPRQLSREIEAAANHGFATDDEESEIGKRCVAAPIYDERGNVMAALSLSAQRATLPDGLLASTTLRLTAASKEITRACGGYIQS